MHTPGSTFSASGGLKTQNLLQAWQVGACSFRRTRLIHALVAKSYEESNCCALQCQTCRTAFPLETGNCTQNMPYAPRCLLPACAAKLRRAASQGGAPDLVTPRLMACASAAVLPYALAYSTATTPRSAAAICSCVHSLPRTQHPSFGVEVAQLQSDHPIPVNSGCTGSSASLRCNADARRNMAAAPQSAAATCFWVPFLPYCHRQHLTAV